MSFVTSNLAPISAAAVAVATGALLGLTTAQWAAGDRAPMVVAGEPGGVVPAIMLGVTGWPR